MNFENYKASCLLRIEDKAHCRGDDEPSCIEGNCPAWNKGKQQADFFRRRTDRLAKKLQEKDAKHINNWYNLLLKCFNFNSAGITF